MISKRKRRLQKQLFGFSASRSVANRALRLAKANRRKLKSVTELSTSIEVDENITLNATAVTQYLQPPALSGGLKDEWTVTMLQVRGVIKQNLTSAIIDDYRVDYVMDRRPEGADVTALIVYGTATPSYEEYPDFDQRGRFKILKSFRGHFNSNDGVNSSRELNFDLRQNVKQTSSSGQVTVDDLLTNAYYMISWTTATANQPTIVSKIRLLGHD